MRNRLQSQVEGTKTYRNVAITYINRCTLVAIAELILYSYEII